MPLHQTLKINDSTTIYLWKITEPFEDLFDTVALTDVNYIRLNTMKSEGHQKGFLSVRMLLNHCGYSDFDLYYDEFGKPHLNDGKHISISHSFDFSAIAISDENIGIDLELIKEKVLKIAPRFMEISHLEHLSHQDQMKKATIIWGIKESIFKLENEVGISFLDHIFENPFQLAEKKCTAELHFNNTIQQYTIYFEEIDSNDSEQMSQNYTLVCAMK
ncbi:4'-phosphopantetheinyl transferase superfamily protein [Flavobacterium amnicola]|uniref:4'-phosphopantetheinyl transferase superfamily protein n=1 Tax=Flavobacterium amnicola TaxID=2506422 RepID=A0A4V1N277_9FLAO|nr:4'-phosphopantetheinyl transferase superfamily protein [Flavobacterium amnicola]RXR20761.1 4'-phosphopantetheinyl transferase superfamily protein [Flavobacterium amnicola]